MKETALACSAALVLGLLGHAYQTAALSDAVITCSVWFCFVWFWEWLL